MNTPELLEQLCRLTTEVLACDFSHTWLADEDETFAPVSGFGDSAEQWESMRLVRIDRNALARHLARVQEEEVVQVTAHEESGPLARLIEQYGTTLSLYIALRRGDSVVGFLHAGFRGRHDPFPAQRVRIARGMAYLASMALETTRLVEELERANRFKSDFLAAMSHELRTPLNVIIGYNSLVLEGTFGELNEDQADTARRIDKNARELLELVSATLDLTRFESKRVPLNLEQIEVAEMIDEVARETRPLLQKPGVDARWEVEEHLPPLRTDPLKLKMVLKNLIGNAIKFTEQGTVEIGVRGLEGGIEFRITDTGIGISPQAKATIFEPFQQAHSRIIQRYGGAGLGLYLVKRILSLLDGTITVESELGKGSTFRFWVPVVGPSTVQDAPPQQTASI